MEILLLFHTFTLLLLLNMSDSENYVKVWQERQGKKSVKLQVTGLIGDRGGKKSERDNEANSLQSTSIIDQKQKNLKTEKLKNVSTVDFELIGDIDKYHELIPEEVIKERKQLKAEKSARKVLKHSGTFIFFVSLLSTIIIVLPFLGIGTKKPQNYNKNVPTIKLQSEDIEAKVIREAESIGLDARFSLYVPKINAKSKVLENIDLEKASEYLAALKRGVAHGKGTYFPGQGKNIFLFSHSVSAPEFISAYNAVFYDLKLLEPGDEIIIYFSGVKYVYIVSEKIIVKPREVDFLTKDYGGETLILQTCDPPGTTLRRLLVIAELNN